MDYSCYKLAFTQPLHIGSNRPGFEHTEEFIRADTLFSALMNAWGLLYPEDLNIFFPESNGRLSFPAFRISSAFPFVGEQLFFPKPRWPLGKRKTEVTPLNLAKKIKKLAWIEQSLFEDWIAGLPQPFNPEGTFGEGRYWSPGKKDAQTQAKSPVSIANSPRVVKNRLEETTTPFTFARLYFQRDAGLYFLAEFTNDQWLDKFTAVLRLLGDEGIGGDRSAGHGQFQVSDPVQVSINTPDEGDYWVILSPFHPGVDEVAEIGKQSSYELINRSGWITAGYARPLRRKSVRMFGEGSVLQCPRPGGDLVRVLDRNVGLGLEHAVYRYGRAFALPFHPGEVEQYA